MTVIADGFKGEVSLFVNLFIRVHDVRVAHVILLVVPLRLRQGVHHVVAYHAPVDNLSDDDTGSITDQGAKFASLILLSIFAAGSQIRVKQVVDENNCCRHSVPGECG